uniref:Uncharacterized protein n=1 Tax=Siphoviridae sp. ctDcW16 TaxID=2826199 RepID=A0A8S5MT02_9CAUD|nr:MAG TPA: hypothetical protein [Siphoviridae sp. ctDcW16]
MKNRTFSGDSIRLPLSFYYIVKSNKNVTCFV